MEREFVYKNLKVIQEAVLSNEEILPDNHQENRVKIASLEHWKKSPLRDKERSKFIISKTIAFSPSVFEEDHHFFDQFFSLSSKIIAYCTERGMGQVAELIFELIHNEERKNTFYHDYSEEETGS